MPQPQLIEDEGWSFVDWIQANTRALTIGASIVVVGALGLWFYQRSGELKRLNAERQLNQAKQSIAAGNAPLAQTDLQRVATRYAGTPAGAQAAMILAQMQFDEGKFNEGLETLRPYQDRGSESQAAVLSLVADGQMATGNAEAASQTYQRAADATRAPGEKAVHRAKAARAMMAAGKSVEALALWQQLADDPDAALVHAEAQIRLGELSVKPAGQS